MRFLHLLLLLISMIIPDVTAQAHAVHKELKPYLYIEPTNKQWEIIMSNHDLILINGGNRSGKTATIKTILSWAIHGVYPLEGVFPKPPLKIRVCGKPISLKENFQGDDDFGLAYLIGEHNIVEKGGLHPTYKYCKYWKLADGTLIDFISYNEDILNLAGVPRDIIAFDEPPPSSDILRESVMRLAKIVMAFTPVKEAGWVYMDYYQRPSKADVKKFSMAIWDNCKCLTPKRHDNNALFPLDAEGHCRCNSGYTHKVKIDRALSLITDPLVRKAVEFGEFLFIHRAIFPEFDQAVHTFDPHNPQNLPYPDEWDNELGRPKVCTAYIIIDPHDNKQDAMKLYVVDRHGFIYQIAESPSWFEGKWAQIDFQKTDEQHYRDTAKTIHNWSIKYKIVPRRIGIDPHFASKKSKESGLRIVKLYNNEMRRIDNRLPAIRLVKPDKDGKEEISAGLKILHDWLHYNEKSKVEKGNRPKYYLSRECYRSIEAYINFRRKEDSAAVEEIQGISGKYEERFKHWIDNDRYLAAMKPEHYHEVPIAIQDKFKPVSPGVA